MSLVGAQGLPLLKETLRKLQVMVHPDKFGQHPHASAANTQSLAALQGFLSSIQSLEGSYPPASMQPLHFYVRNDKGDLKQLKTTLRTTGGDCRKLVEAQLGQLFTAVGLPAAFRWQEGFWEMKDAPPEPEAARDGSDNDVRDTAAPDYNFHNPYPKKKKEADSAKSARPTEDFELPAGIQRQYVDEATLNEQRTVPVRTDETGEDAMPQIFLNSGDNNDLKSELDAMDPLLEAVACIPWIEDDDERDEIIRVGLMDHLEMTGWKIGEAVERIWRGERNEVSLVAGADANSAAMISRILTHAHHIEVTFGPAKRVEFRPLLRAQLE